MLTEIPSFIETLLTLSTLIATNFRLWLVFLYVFTESRCPMERFSTDGAKILGFSSVNAHVFLKTSFCDKGLLTQITLELFLYFVKS